MNNYTSSSGDSDYTFLPYLNATTASDADMMSYLQQQQSILSNITSDFDSADSSTDLLLKGMDASWTLMGSYFVFIMTLGFALSVAGAVKAINTKNALYQCTIACCCSIIGFWVLGFGLTQGTSIGFADAKKAATIGLDTFPDFMFMWSYSNLCVLVVCQAVTSRIGMKAFVVLTLVVSALLFPICTYWSSTGFLSHLNGGLGVIDFAGGLAVHVLGGTVAFTAAFMIGPRHDRFVFNSETGCLEDRREPGHSVVFTLIGVFLLWFGWFAFTAAASEGLVNARHLIAGHASVATLIAAGVGSLSLTGYHMLFSDVHNLWELLNGLVCGLVAISPAAGTVDCWAAVLIGITCIFPYRFGVRAMEWMRVDSVVESFAIHGCCGAYGVIMTAFLSTQSHVDQMYGAGLVNFEIGRQLGVQILGVVCTMALGVIGTVIPLFIVKKLFELRESLEDEKIGLDATHHGGYAYPDFKQKMSNLKNQVILEAELGAAVKTSGVTPKNGNRSTASTAQLDTVTERIRQLDEMRRAQAKNGTSNALKSPEISAGPGAGGSRKQYKSILRASGQAQFSQLNNAPPVSQGGVTMYLGGASQTSAAKRYALRPEDESKPRSPTLAWNQHLGLTPAASMNSARDKRLAPYPSSEIRTSDPVVPLKGIQIDASPRMEPSPINSPTELPSFDVMASPTFVPIDSKRSDELPAGFIDLSQSKVKDAGQTTSVGSSGSTIEKLTGRDTGRVQHFRTTSGGGSGRKAAANGANGGVNDPLVRSPSVGSYSDDESDEAAAIKRSISMSQASNESAADKNKNSSSTRGLIKQMSSGTR